MRGTARIIEPLQSPTWLHDLLAKGYRPYIATSRHLLSSLNVNPFGYHAQCHLLDDQKEIPFFESYLVSSSLSFAPNDLKVPHTAMIDCVLMQSAIVGFTRATRDIPTHLRKHYEGESRGDLSVIERIPVSGQIASPTPAQGSFMGTSLFSLGKQLDEERYLGLYTKALALEVYRARQDSLFYGISQYDNPALRIHGRFSSCMEVEQAMVPLHPRKEMALVYKMKIDYDPYDLKTILGSETPTFWLNANDTDRKRAMQKGLREGTRYEIAPPFSVYRNKEIFLPIIEREGINHK